MLHFDIDTDQLEQVANKLGATDQQIKYAFNRALNRTASKLRTLSARGLKSELDLRKMKDIRRRLKMIKIRRTSLNEVKLWFGANDMAVRNFKGTAKQTPTGAEFRGQKFSDAFVARGVDGKRTVFVRKHKKKAYPIKEGKMPVKDKIDVFVEDEIFTETENIFFKEFKRDLTARTMYGVGRG